MQINDLDLSDWKNYDVNTDSLWLIAERDKSGKHKNIYHGNFIPQISNQLLRRYTKEGEVVFEPFMGSGTTLFECENLNRKYIGFDINPLMSDYVRQSMRGSNFSDFFIAECDSADTQNVDRNLDVNSLPLIINFIDDNNERYKK